MSSRKLSGLLNDTKKLAKEDPLLGYFFIHRSEEFVTKGDLNVVSIKYRLLHTTKPILYGIYSLQCSVRNDNHNKNLEYLESAHSDAMKSSLYKQYLKTILK